ncbi:MAG: YdeI/OmpD-associated family protein [Pseudomonadota bacterium]
MHRAKSASEFFAKAPLWRAELTTLRKALLASGLVEEIKWGGPCYTLDGVNVVGLGAFKSYFGLWFFQGALLTDPQKVLVNAQEGRTKAQRQWRMSAAGDIKPALISRYLKEAIALAKSGEKVAKAPPKKLVMPPELAKALTADKAAAEAFKSLTPGRQREYAEYVSEAKQAATKEKRVAKILPKIRAGGGLNDEYRKC